MIPFIKGVLAHSHFNIIKFVKDDQQPYLIFINGGPGYSCDVLEHLIEYENLFEKLNYNVILYDQRGCGKSINFSNATVLNADNVNDLKTIYSYIQDEAKLKIKGFIGHSYGAKILYDFHKKFNLNIPSVFVSTANSILIPRLNNISLDLAYLKKTNKDKYQKLVSGMNTMSLNALWEMTEELAPLFMQNEDRPYLYWANLKSFEKVKKIESSINSKVFTSVRKDLYLNEENYSVEIKSLNIKYLWIKGFHDFIMNGIHDVFSASEQNQKIFYKSAHFPHIEENNHFCEVLNDFFD